MLAHRRWIRREQGSEEVADALARGDLEAAPVDAADRQMLRYAAKRTLHPSDVCEDDIHALRQVGFEDAAIADMAVATAMYAFMNRVVDGLGRALPRGMDREAERLGLLPSSSDRTGAAG
ncbi:MAG TPA: hypothetical protein VNE17_03500 [Nitrolancea sp.]|nr:hypothetical protein [Nitrolancea sp.]